MLRQLQFLPKSSHQAEPYALDDCNYHRHQKHKLAQKFRSTQIPRAASDSNHEVIHDEGEL